MTGSKEEDEKVEEKSEYSISLTDKINSWRYL